MSASRLPLMIHNLVHTVDSLIISLPHGFYGIL